MGGWIDAFAVDGILSFQAVVTITIHLHLTSNVVIIAANARCHGGATLSLGLDNLDDVV